MDIVTTISDLCLVYAMCVPLIYIEIKKAINPGMTALVTTPVVLLLMIPVFTILYPFRHMIAGMELVYLAWMQLRKYQRVGRPLQEINNYYMEQLGHMLADVEVVWVSMYGLESRPTNKSLPQAYLFIDYATYLELLDGHVISQMRWEILEIIGKPDSKLYSDRLFLVLFLDRLDTSTIALPMNIGMQSKKRIDDQPDYQSSYIWRLMLKYVHMGAELNLYPIKKHQARKLNYWNTDRRYRRVSPFMPYFHRHIEYLPHIRLKLPPFTHDMLLYLMKLEHIDQLSDDTGKFLDMSLSVYNQSYIYKHHLIKESEIYDSIREKMNS